MCICCYRLTVNRSWSESGYIVFFGFAFVCVCVVLSSVFLLLCSICLHFCLFVFFILFTNIEPFDEIVIFQRTNMSKNTLPTL